ATAVAITKTDVAPIFDFDRDRAARNVRMRNADAPVFATCAKTGDGVKELSEYISSKLKAQN
ncbi:MAG: hydrogenase accessory protein HypB, partial [Clostridia bacterium]|nr:hydrogenase accessory protein HypB [Clostridia bacterium]